jgi:hypothetical protein
MTQRIARAAAVATLTLTGSLALVPMTVSAALADGSGQSKAAIEHQELLSAASTNQPSSKAQIEHQEMTARDSSSSTSTSTDPAGSASSSGDAAVWQLAISAALGAALTGSAFLGARQMANHRSHGQPVAP